ncbi:MAG: hypothetical protein AAFQ54_13480 [Pseudomonadota bacterium]
MLEDKRVDLDAEKQKRVLRRLVEDLTRESADIYYQPTSVIARIVKAQVEAGKGLNADELDLLRRLSQRDIEVLLSLH